MILVELFGLYPNLRTTPLTQRERKSHGAINMTQMRLDIHFGMRTKAEAEKIAKKVSKLLRCEVYLVVDSTERVGTRFEAAEITNRWADDKK